MKKIVYILVAVIVSIFISTSNFSYNIKENIVYSKDLEYTSIEKLQKELSIDDSKLIERSKEILISIYPNLDFNNHEVVVKSNGGKLIYVAFSKENLSEYLISFNLEEGSLYQISKMTFINSYKNISEAYKGIEELRTRALEYLDKLKIVELQNYKLVEDKISDGYYFAYYENFILNKTIAVMHDPSTGELLDFNLYKARELDRNN